MKRLLPLLMLLGSASLAAGCGAKTAKGESTPTPAPTDGPFSLDTVAPADLKANFSGDVLLTGIGFDSSSDVLVDGTSSGNYGTMTVTVQDPYTIDLAIAWTGTAGELAAGDHQISVLSNGRQTAPVTLHVRPYLRSLTHVRTLPGLFLKNGGFLDLWTIPTDSSAAFMGPGEEIAGASGLSDVDFSWDNVKVVPAGGATSVGLDSYGVADVVFEPVGVTKPLAVTLTIDMSGSMIGLGSNPVPSDPNEQRITQAEAFVARMGAMDEAEVISFAGGPGAYVVQQTFTSDKVKLKAALEGLRGKEGGNTPLYDAMLKSVNDLHALNGTFMRAGIVLTDGRDDESTTTPATIISTARTDGVPVFSIGLGNPNDATSLDRVTLQSIADSTGGRFFFSADSTGLQSVFDQLTDLLTDSYRLESAVSFNPPLTTAGAYVITGDVTCTVDGETRTVPMAPISVSVQ